MLKANGNDTIVVSPFLHQIYNMRKTYNVLKLAGAIKKMNSLITKPLILIIYHNDMQFGTCFPLPS